MSDIQSIVAGIVALASIFTFGFICWITLK